MQFHHAHTFRGQVVDVLRAEMPDVLDDLIGAGATIATTANRPPALLLPADDFRPRAVEARGREPGLSLVTGHVDGILRHAAAPSASRSGRTWDADLVIDASGRASRFTGACAPRRRRDCGATYVTSAVPAAAGRDAGPMNSPIGLSLGLPGYWAIAFLHDNGAFSITFVHDGTDERLRHL